MQQDIKKQWHWAALMPDGFVEGNVEWEQDAEVAGDYRESLAQFVFGQLAAILSDTPGALLLSETPLFVYMPGATHHKADLVWNYGDVSLKRT